MLTEASRGRGQVVLFMEDLHQYVGSYTERSTSDITRAAVEGGRLHLIGATTATIYGEYIAKDSGLARLLEITESIMMENAEASSAMLVQLRNLGVQLSIDDFGTGYSSLSYLHRFPVNTLKIDRSFVTRMGDAGENSEIVRTILTLASNLGMDVIAEGVRDEGTVGATQGDVVPLRAGLPLLKAGGRGRRRDVGRRVGRRAGGQNCRAELLRREEAEQFGSTLVM